MKKLLIIGVAIVILLLGSIQLFADDVKALVVVPYLFGANSFLSIEKLHEMGWEITTTGLTNTVQPCFWGDPLSVDFLVSEVTNITDYDCLILCPAQSYASPSSAYSTILNSTAAMDLFVNANANGLVIFATCAGVRCLAAADIINGVNITGKDYYINEYTAAGANFLGSGIPAVIDGNIVTSTRGQYYWQQNIEAIRTAMENLISSR